MTTDTNVGDPAQDGAGGNQPQVSPDQGQPIAGTPQSSQEVLELKKTVDLLSKELRGLQSRQDVGQNEVQSFMAEVKQHMAKGKSLEEAEAAVTASREAQAKDDLLIRMARKLGVIDEVSQTPAAGTGGNVTGSVAQVISAAQLDANTPEVIDLIRQYGNDPVTFAVKAGELRAKATNRPTPDAAAASSIPAAPQPRTDKAVEIERGYLDEAAKVPRGNIYALDAVKRKWRAKAREAGLQLNV